MQTELLAQSVEAYRELAKHWSPRIYHDTDDSYYVGDYITKFNFDGDYNGKNNWENLARFSSVPAHVYYGVSETETHYFIHYALFHPRDWHEWLTADMHENDLEGISLAIAKTGGFGSLVAMETLAHDQFYQYSGVPDVTAGSETIDGKVSFYDGSHPRVFVEAKGHGIYGCDARCDDAPGGDGIVYAEGGVADSPTSGEGNFSQVYSYALIDLSADGHGGNDQGLWYRRNDICDTCTFGSWGRLRGDNFGTDVAKTAWAWDDPDDGEVYAGAMLCDPALFFDVHLNGTPFDVRYSNEYVTHPFATHWFEVTEARSNANLDLWGGLSDLYVRVVAPGSPAGTNELLSESSWKQNDAAPGTWYSVSRGTANATGQRQYASPRTSHYFCREGEPRTRFEVYDSDTDSDDLMGVWEIVKNGDWASKLTSGAAQLRFAYDVRH